MGAPKGGQEEAFLKHEVGPPHSQIVLRMGWLDLKSSELPGPSSVQAGDGQPPVREAAEWCLVLGEELEWILPSRCFQGSYPELLRDFKMSHHHPSPETPTPHQDPNP